MVFLPPPWLRQKSSASKTRIVFVKLLQPSKLTFSGEGSHSPFGEHVTLFRCGPENHQPFRHL